ncbi:MAG: hypothetical protein KKB51_10755, partial [Candidatus Riflebacteria bacterium]|nr:hypothetical protein [Candidatus Riflebacteria bacterium]
LEHAKKEKLKDLIFITDDNKTDWWLQIDCNGVKTIGIRPELIDEITRVAGVDRFYAYNTEGFLSYANELLDVRVTDDAIKEVRAVSISRHVKHREVINSRRVAFLAERAVYGWLLNIFDVVKNNPGGFLDFIAFKEGRKYGFEIKLIREPRMVLPQLGNMLIQAFHKMNDDGFNEISLIFVVLDEDLIEETIHYLRGKKFLRDKKPELKTNVRIIVGKADIDESLNAVFNFIPYDEI